LLAISAAGRVKHPIAATGSEVFPPKRVSLLGFRVLTIEFETMIVRPAYAVYIIAVITRRVRVPLVAIIEEEHPIPAFPERSSHRAVIPPETIWLPDLRVWLLCEVAIRISVGFQPLTVFVGYIVWSRAAYWVFVPSPCVSQDYPCRPP